MAPQRMVSLEALTKLVKEGLNIEAISERLNCDRSHLYKMCRDNDIWGEKVRPRKPGIPKYGEAAVVVDFDAPPPKPPRPSMYALAEFDPVIARALHARLTQATPTPAVLVPTNYPPRPPNPELALEYINTGTSFRALSKKYGISIGSVATAVRMHKAREAKMAAKKEGA